MQALLAWLWEQASKVYLWFSDKFWTWWSYLNNFTYYLTSTLNSAINYASDVVIRTANTIYNVVSSWITSVYNTVSEWINTVYNTVSSWITSVYSTVSGWINTVYQFINASITGAYDFVLWWIDELKGWTQRYVDVVVSGLVSLIAPILNVISFIINLINFFSSDVLTKLEQYVNRVHNIIILFVDDPVGFIVGLLTDVFVSFLCYRIAKALGTVKYDLPPEPTWSIFQSQSSTGDNHTHIG